LNILPNSDYVKTMRLILAIDLMNGTVVHGAKGQRDTYAPLDWGLAASAEPEEYVKEMAPKYLYIADLDRIEGRGSHEDVIERCARLVECCYVDRGCTSAREYLHIGNVVNVVGTETGGAYLEDYTGGFLSVDIKGGRVIPDGADPVEMLAIAESLSFDGCIILNLGSVGTESGIFPQTVLETMRASYSGTLLYGGGVRGVDDIRYLTEAGFDGAIVATAVHHGAIPLAWIRRGSPC
jgi:phosphoribosylformimino-5-aminoimidazole carboxamide ribotide isomerase